MMSAAEVVHPDLKKSPFKIISAMKSGPSLPFPLFLSGPMFSFSITSLEKIVQKIQVAQKL